MPTQPTVPDMIRLLRLERDYLERLHNRLLLICSNSPMSDEDFEAYLELSRLANEQAKVCSNLQLRIYREQWKESA